MRRTSAAILVLVCFGLLAAQWSGVHAHVNAHGFHGAVQVMHDHDHHGHGNGDDGHEGDIDVRAIDFGLNASKILVFLVALGLPLFFSSPARGAAPSQQITPLPFRRRARWRPPLRAPPLVHIVL